MPKSKSAIEAQRRGGGAYKVFSFSLPCGKKKGASGHAGIPRHAEKEKGRMVVEVAVVVVEGVGGLHFLFFFPPPLPLL